MGATMRGADELSHDLGEAAHRAVEDCKKIVGKGCLNVKKESQRIIKAASHRGYLPHYPRAISYDVTTRGTVVSGEIGAKTEKLQGGLSRILEEGTVNNAPIPHMDPALSLEEPRFIRFMEELGAKLLEGEPVAGGPVVDPGGG